MASLRNHARKYVRAEIHEGATVYKDVAIRLKGGPGSFRPVDNQPSFTINFDKLAGKQTFHGLKKIHLNSSVQDSSYLSEKISRGLFDAAGVPAPRAGNAKVMLNGHVLGLYVLVEGINHQFLHRYFKDANGNVYDGHSGSDVTDPLPVNSGENPRDKSALLALARATREPVETRLAALEKTLDVDRFLSFMAMETILWHWDGYSMHRNNFRIFHDRASGRMVFLPQGLDQILTRPNGSIFAETGGLVARSLMEIPEARDRYRSRIAELSTNVFRADAVLGRIREVAEKIEAALNGNGPQTAAAHRQRVNDLCRRVQQRATSLNRQIFPAAVPMLAKLENIAAADWQPKTDLGEAQLNREQDAEGRTLLHVATSSGCTASWRTRVMLQSGNYRFEARLKTKGVVLNSNDPRAGAGLRISRFRKGQKNSGNRDWTPVAFDFQVQQDQSEIELVCELRAEQGDVWFDLSSFKLAPR